MILKLGLRSVLCAVAVAMVMLNLFAMAPALASSPSCQPVHAENAADHRHDAATPCCDSMHCCPMLPNLPSPGLPLAAGHRHHPYLKVEEPLLLATAIDPPPRTSAS